MNWGAFHHFIISNLDGFTAMDLLILNVAPSLIKEHFLHCSFAIFNYVKDLTISSLFKFCSCVCVRLRRNKEVVH